MDSVSGRNESDILVYFLVAQACSLGTTEAPTCHAGSSPQTIPVLKLSFRSHDLGQTHKNFPSDFPLFGFLGESLPLPPSLCSPSSFTALLCHHSLLLFSRLILSLFSRFKFLDFPTTSFALFPNVTFFSCQLCVPCYFSCSGSLTLCFITNSKQFLPVQPH